METDKTLCDHHYHFACCGTHWDSYSLLGLWVRVPGAQFCMAWGEHGTVSVVTERGVVLCLRI